MLRCSDVTAVQPVRRNYSLTVKDFEADRQKDVERAHLLKIAAAGNSFISNTVCCVF